MRKSSPSTSLSRTYSRSMNRSVDCKSDRKVNSTALTNLSISSHSRTQTRFFATVSFSQDNNNSRKFAQSQLSGN